MTNERAKSELMQIYMSLSEEKKKALDMAIKALEYDDAKYHEEHGEVIVDKGLWEDAKKALEQEPKIGHWIYDRTRDWDGECKYECSECGMGSDVDYAYCMRCGCRMVDE